MSLFTLISSLLRPTTTASRAPRQPPRTRPSLETLEDRRLLSGLGEGVPVQLERLSAPVVPVAGTQRVKDRAKSQNPWENGNPGKGSFSRHIRIDIPPPVLMVVGQLAGTYRQPFSNPDTGHRYDLKGAGSLTGLGRWRVTGELGSLGFIRIGNARGEVTLQGPRGTLTLDFEGPRQHGFSPLPAHFQFSQTAGTGVFQNLDTKGSAALQLAPSGNASRAGTFSLQLKFSPETLLLSAGWPA
jgi:hypothetical protein